ARAIAAAASGDAKKAEALRKEYAAARDALGSAMTVGPLNSAADYFAVATNVLDARIAQAKGDRKAAVASWEKAVAAEDALHYDEPATWYYPTRESLGAALLLDGQAAEAEKVFRADLERHPRNGRSLYGLAKSLEAQQKAADAAWTRAQFETAWKDADTKLRLEDM
ncbi:MAG TPA: hypothetical protein VFA98_05040, partial [Thermoanaerobaculia bacterium]|nr:hypothetical protein [Thermoanaerobaculia bacterium]